MFNSIFSHDTESNNFDLYSLFNDRYADLFLENFKQYDDVPEFDLERSFSFNERVDPEKFDISSTTSDLPTQGTENASAYGGSEQFPPRKSSNQTSCFGGDDTKSDSNVLRSPNSIQLGDSSSIDRILLRMVDEESLSFLIKEEIPISNNLKEFIACNLEVISKYSFSDIANETDQEWVLRANIHLKNSSQKRKDQKLRMIFNKIVKMLFNNSLKKTSSRETKSSKMETFLNKYAPSNKTGFEEFIRDCKFPSKKKLKVIFNEFKLFRSDFAEILEKDIFATEYLNKRNFKAARLVENFNEAKKNFGNDKKSIVACLKDCIKSFPWSTTDLKTSFALLYSTLGMANNRMSF